ncbi:hypothetical protein ONZ51_g13366 [Trametes cubensis]|uniref:MARVEL domain-containing protein n=1 Tax=Trametes cubensis TaxID=1111947 RepID=A0AAD7X606_9APHY|nr:hypothetical protein ONZ51_g13366 [Trametes cubensis]
MTWLQLVRLITLGFTLGCGIIVLSLASHVTSLSEEYYAIYYAFEALGIAVGALTMVSIPVMIAIDFLRTGAFTSMVVVELSWLSVLWVLWLATAAQTADQTSVAFANCDFGNVILNQVCNETHAIEAFSFLARFGSPFAFVVLSLLGRRSAHSGEIQRAPSVLWLLADGSRTLPILHVRTVHRMSFLRDIQRVRALVLATNHNPLGIRVPSLPLPHRSAQHALTSPLSQRCTVMGYTILLLVVALINGSRGAPMWMSSVKQMPSIVPAPLAGASTQMGTVSQQQPAAGQYQYPAQQPGQQQQAYAPVPTASPPSTVAYSTTAAAPSTHSPGYPQV